MSLLRKLSRGLTGIDLLPPSHKRSVAVSSMNQAPDSSVTTGTSIAGGLYGSSKKVDYYSTAGGGGAQVAGAISPMHHPGYHLNKHGYFTKGGGTSHWPAKMQYHAAGTVWVKNRRMHVGNSRALRRSFRRVKGFARMASRTISFVKRHRLKKHHAS